jgi:hypothetical protein
VQCPDSEWQVLTSPAGAAERSSALSRFTDQHPIRPQVAAYLPSAPDACSNALDQERIIGSNPRDQVKLEQPLAYEERCPYNRRPNSGTERLRTSTHATPCRWLGSRKTCPRSQQVGTTPAHSSARIG